MTATIENRSIEPLIMATSFLKQFVMNPFEVGSLIPSSRWLAASMLENLPTKDFNSVIEYGPGNGSFTSIIYQRLGPQAQFITVEPNNFFAEQIQTQFPKAIVVRDYADRVGFYLGENRGAVDLVVSGLPFSLMDWSTIEKTITETAQILRPGGHFRTFVYCHMNYYWKIRELKKLLQGHFAETTYVSVYRNFPPAFVIKCRK